jgi:hypothetical protein
MCSGRFIYAIVPGIEGIEKGILFFYEQAKSKERSRRKPARQSNTPFRQKPEQGQQRGPGHAAGKNGIEGKKYSFPVETIPSEEPAVVYRAVPAGE